MTSVDFLQLAKDFYSHSIVGNDRATFVALCMLEAHMIFTSGK